MATNEDQWIDELQEDMEFQPLIDFLDRPRVIVPSELWSKQMTNYLNDLQSEFGPEAFEAWLMQTEVVEAIAVSYGRYDDLDVVAEMFEGVNMHEDTLHDVLVDLERFSRRVNA